MRVRWWVGLLLVLSSIPPRAAHAAGLIDSLPPIETSSCGPSPSPLTPTQARLQRAAAAVRADYLPLEPLVTRTIAGVRLHDDPRALDVVARTLGKKPPLNWDTAKHCHDSVCALRAAVSGMPDSWEAALLLLDIGAQGPVASLDQTPWIAPSMWSAQELRTVAATLRDMAAPLRYSKLRVIRNVPAGERVPVAMAAGHQGTLAAATTDLDPDGVAIAILENVWANEPVEQRTIIAHEIGHTVDLGHEPDNRFGLSHGPHWLEVGNWTRPLITSLPIGYTRPHSTDEEPWTDQAWPNEEFAEAMAHYRYAGELLRAYSPGAYAFVAPLFDEEYRAPRDPRLDALIAGAGGPLTLFDSCARLVVASWLPAHGGPAFIERACDQTEMAGQGTSDRWNLVAIGKCRSCIDLAIDRLRAQPGYAALACARDPDDLAVEISERLNQVAAAFLRAGRAVLAARGPSLVERCLSAGDLRSDCLAGPAGVAAARREAEQMLLELGRARNPSPKPAAVDYLAEQILRQTALGLDQKSLRSRLPQLPLIEDGQALLAACLGGVTAAYRNPAASPSPSASPSSSSSSLASATPAKPRWLFRMKGPDGKAHEYTDPLQAEACPPLFAAQLNQRGIHFDRQRRSDLWRLALPHAQRLQGRLYREVISTWPEMRKSCHVVAAVPPTAEQRSCATDYLAQRLHGVVRDEDQKTLAARLALWLLPPAHAAKN